MKNFILAAALATGSMNVQAQGMTDAQEFCSGAIKYAWNFVSDENSHTLHQAEWQILTSEKVNDQQKLMSVMVFHAVQQFSYGGETPTDEQIKKLLAGLDKFCMDKAELHTPPDELDEMKDSGKGIF